MRMHFLGNPRTSQDRHGHLSCPSCGCGRWSHWNASCLIPSPRASASAKLSDRPSTFLDSIWCTRKVRGSVSCSSIWYPCWVLPAPNHSSCTMSILKRVGSRISTPSYTLVSALSYFSRAITACRARCLRVQCCQIHFRFSLKYENIQNAKNGINESLNWWMRRSRVWFIYYF